jgi:dTDP-4-amino-4,6-dideoxygalactose transaminase
MIPLSIPKLNGNEWKYIKDCLDTNWVSSVGAYVDRFERAIKDFTGAKHAIACMNGTAALHISLLLSGVQPDDYVIVPNITFIASINSIKYANADPILIDMEADTWQMDLDLLEDFLQNRTGLMDGVRVLTADNRPIRCIMPVHVHGNMNDMKQLTALANQYQLTIVEDSTEALGSFYDGQHAGTFGKFGTFSFNGNKIITTGGGGMVITDDEECAKKANI